MWQSKVFSSRCAVAALVLVLILPAGFRCWFGVKRIESLSKRACVDVPGVRGLLLFSHEAQIISLISSVREGLPPELLKRGIFNHTPDGIWSILLPGCDFRHPLYCRIGESIYPDYDSRAFRYCMDKKPAVISGFWKQLPGYVTMQVFTYNGVDYAILFPIR